MNIVIYYINLESNLKEMVLPAVQYLILLRYIKSIYTIQNLILKFIVK
jgi:hypothetical protein